MNYDTIEGIKTYLARGLVGLNELVKDRHEAGYGEEHHCGLHQFLIMGRWGTDSCGNFGPATLMNDNYQAMPVPRDFPSVISYEDMKKHGIESLSVSGMNNLPFPEVQCTICFQRWTLENAHDVHTESTFKKQILSGWRGQTLRDYEEGCLKKLTSGRFFLGREPSIRNDKYIGSEKANDKGWLKESVTLDYVIEQFDETSSYAFYYTHLRCHSVDKKIRNFEQFGNIFDKAGFGPFYLREIPNEYEGDNDHSAPWFIVETLHGDIKIGWRKHVINIDWSATGKDFSYLFEEQKVTKWPHGIHAYGSEAAVFLLTRIRKEFDLQWTTADMRL